MKSIYVNLFFALILLTSCSNAQPQNDPIPEHETFTIESKQVGETRTINVWVPLEYKGSKDSLPVLYMPDGGLKEDFPHIANTLDTLIKSKKIKPFILVGIENTERKRDLTGPTEVEKDKEVAPVVGGSEKFRAFISDELFGEINKRYRTTNEKGIIGESLAGLFVAETFLLTPNMFDYYIAFDPSLWWNNKYLTRTAKEHLAKFPATPKRFWFVSSGTKGISATVSQHAKDLETANLSNLKWKYSDEPKEKHNTIFRATKERGLIWALNEQ